MPTDDDVKASLPARRAERQSEAGFWLPAPGEGDAELSRGQYGSGDRWFGDEICGPGEPIEGQTLRPLAHLPRPLYLDGSRLHDGAISAALRHYSQTVIPLRGYRNGGNGLSHNSVTTRLTEIATGQSALRRTQ